MFLLWQYEFTTQNSNAVIKAGYFHDLFFFLFVVNQGYLQVSQNSDNERHVDEGTHQPPRASKTEETVSKVITY